eukprot:1192692-Prorocentrum_minimum.AAC.3
MTDQSDTGVAPNPKPHRCTLPPMRRKRRGLILYHDLSAAPDCNQEKCADHANDNARALHLVPNVTHSFVLLRLFVPQQSRTTNPHSNEYYEAVRLQWGHA